MRIMEGPVLAEWIDYNGHMNDSRYFQFTSEAGDRFLNLIGMDSNYLATGHSYYTVESHINFVGQAKLGDYLHATVQLLSHDVKRLHLYFTVECGGMLVATAEHMMLHVDTRVGKACAAPQTIIDRVSEIAQYHQRLPMPNNAGRHMGTAPNGAM